VSAPGAHRHTRIIATLGPASRDPFVLRRMLEEGLDWARVNYSHGDHDEQARAVETLRVVSRTTGRPVRVVADLGGPKVRIGPLPAPLEVRVGDELVLGSGRDQPEGIPLTMPRALAGRTVGDALAIGDGAIELEVVEVDRGWVRCRAATGGQLRAHQGVVIIGGPEAYPSLTAKDEDDLHAALALGVDAVCLSMVRRREDVTSLRALVPDGVLVMAKVEDAEGLGELGAVMRLADAIVLARGALACTMPRGEVPLVQKEVLARCAAEGRMGIVATEMLLSMVDRPRPTRAEASDITTALLDGADALLLSEETAVGAHPIDAVAELRQIAEAVEASPWYSAVRTRRHFGA
jgi:pyruvate kinase